MAKKKQGSCVACKRTGRYLCQRCQEVRYCSKKHLLLHEKTCLPSSMGLSATKVQLVQKFAADLPNSSLDRFMEIVHELTQWVAFDEEQDEHVNGFLGDLAVWPHDKARTVFIKAGGVPRLVEALERHKEVLLEAYLDDKQKHLHNGLAVVRSFTRINEQVLMSTVESTPILALITESMKAVWEEAHKQHDSLATSNIRYFKFLKLMCNIFALWLVMMSKSNNQIQNKLMEYGVIDMLVKWMLEIDLDNIRNSHGPDDEAQTVVQGFLKDVCWVFCKFSEYNFMSKTNLVRAGALPAIARITTACWNVEIVKPCCQELWRVIYCRCAQCMESNFCNHCGAKGHLGCACSRVRYCSKQCQAADWQAHKKLCREARKIGTPPLKDHFRAELAILVGYDKDEKKKNKDSASLSKKRPSEAETIAILDTLRDAPTIFDVMHQLFLMASCSPALVMKLDGFSRLAGVMHKYRYAPEVQRRAIVLLSHLSSETTEQDDMELELRFDIRKSGCTAAILSAMDRFADNPQVVGPACAALVRQVLVLEPGGKVCPQIVQALVKAMRRHPTDYSVCEGGCGTLWNCALRENNLSAVLDVGAIHLVAAASEKFWGEAGEVDRRASFFFKTIFGTNENQGKTSKFISLDDGSRPVGEPGSYMTRDGLRPQPSVSALENNMKLTTEDPLADFSNIRNTTVNLTDPFPEFSKKSCRQRGRATEHPCDRCCLFAVATSRR